MDELLAQIKSWLGTGSINIFGMPFAGKDTQAGSLADLLGAEAMGGGQILRNSIIPPHVRQIMDAGELIPTKDYLDIVLPYLRHDRFARKPLILSSVGRWAGEETGVVQAAQASGHPIKAVVLINVDETTARQRHEAGSVDRGERADDAAELFDTRLDEYRTKTQPVIDYYRNEGLLVEIDGNAEPVQVTRRILDALRARTTDAA